MMAVATAALAALRTTTRLLIPRVGGTGGPQLVEFFHPR